MRRSIVPLLALALSLADAATAQTTITVGPGGGYDYASIQSAIDAATTGDTVVVHRGTYYENIHFHGKNIILRSTDPTDTATVAATIIDGNQADSVVTFAGTETSSCVLEGFTIRNGRASAPSSYNRLGGGIRGISEHSATHALITNNVITSNSAYRGGGLAHCNGTIQRNTIKGNSVEESGGGLFGCDGTVQNNSITSNSAGGAGGGLVSCDGTIQNNTIANNTAGAGGGLYSCGGTIRNNTIFGNTAVGAEWPFSDGSGGGLSFCRGTIRNNIIWGNRGIEEAQLSRCAKPSYCCIQDWTDAGTGIITSDPQLRDPLRGDFHLGPFSPCIDAGGAVSLGQDFEGDPRPFDASLETRGDGSDFDIGADEFNRDENSLPPAQPVNVSPPDGATSVSATPILVASPFSNPDPGGLHVVSHWQVRNAGSPADYSEAVLDFVAADDLTSITIPPFILRTGTRYAWRVRYGSNRGLWSACSHETTFVTEFFTGGPTGALTVGKGVGYDYATIQEAIDAATTGDTVIVYPGTYDENIHLRGKSIILRSVDPTNPAAVAATIIDGHYRDTVVTFAGTETSSGVLAGFTITNGNSGGIRGAGTRATIQWNTISDNLGGGLQGCDGLIRNNEITGNSASYGGGVAFCDGTIQGNTITNNNASTYRGGAGGGLYMCHGTIQNNVISGNTIGRCGSGAGLYDCDGTIQNNTISNNRAESYGCGGGLYDCDGTIQNNAIFDNTAGCYGGGLCCSDGTIQNNTIFGNWARYGGGLSWCNGIIRNCIIWRNYASTGAQLDTCSTPLYSCIQNWSGGGVGNISDDPQLVDPLYGDFHLKAGSPCIDAGVNFYWFEWPQRDFDGNCRLAGSRVDMGCYEYGSSPDSDGDLLADGDELVIGTDPFVADTDGDGLRDGLEVLRGSDPLVTTLPGVFRVPLDIPTIQEALALSLDGDEIVVSPGTYGGHIQFCGANVILRSESPEDPATVASTVLDGSAVYGPVIRFQGGESESCILAGFTIQNGHANHGAGICGPTQATIQYNTISSNTAVHWGGGLYRCDGTIQKNAIAGNAAAKPQGSVSTGYASVGGGLYRCNGTIQDNTVFCNIADSAGGGLHGCNGTIQNNTVSSNTAGQDGGGLSYCGGTIQFNTISSNTILHGERRGGGLYNCNGTIQNNTISDNTASYGGGLYGCNGTIRNNAISGNSGGGLSGCDGTIWNNIVRGNNGRGLDFCDGLIQNNTISGNTARGLCYCDGTIQNNMITSNSGGLYRCNGTIQNNTIAYHSATTGSGLYRCDGTIRNCIIWRNPASADAQLDSCSTPSYSCIQNWPGGGVGNINDDPRFADPANGDFRLSAGSPCIDAGVSYYWFAWPQRDLDGNCRVAGARVDMGCYEYGSSPDSDGDLMADGDELAIGTDPLVADTDGDGLRDGLEMLRGSDPLVLTLPGVLHVPLDLSTIQKALAVSVNGDEIVVSPGIYSETLQFCGTSVVLRSEVPEDPTVVAATIVDGGGGGPVVSFFGGEGEACILAGFTIRNGEAYYGSGICGPTQATIQYNMVHNNHANAAGGGLHECNGTIQNNTIFSNTAAEDGGGFYRCSGTIHSNTISGNTAIYGGGLSQCHGTIQYNTIANNKAAGDGYGGGLYRCSATIRNNSISGNTACYGGGLSGCDGRIQSNSISGNAATESGGGLYGCGRKPGPYGGGAEVRIQNNSIFNNSATKGGGLSQCYGSILNNTVAHNAATTGGGLHLCTGYTWNCIIWQNSAAAGAQLDNCTTPSYSCIQDWAGGGDGNIHDDPQLADPANGDFHLLPSSPCIDAGGRVSLTEDFEGDPRPYDFTDILRGDGSDFDIGADEAVPAFELRTAADPAAGGRIVPAGTTRHYLARTVTVTAIPNCGWAFDHWSGDAKGTTNPIAVVMDTSKTITAHFVAIPGADLEGRLDGVSRGAIVVGQSVSLQGEVSNAGDGASTQAFWVEFWLHNTQTGWRGVLCDSIRIGPLGAGESFDLADIAPPRMAYTNIPPGMYAIEMRVDVRGEVAESCEANNVARWEPCVILPDRPNLAVTGFDFSPQDVAPDGGTTIAFSGLIENTGSRPTSGSFWIEFHVSRELPFRFAGDYLCDSYKIATALVPGEAIDLATLPARTTYALPPGVYYVGIRLDPLDTIAEQHEDDNVTWLTRKKLYAGPRPTGVRNWRHYR